MPGAMQGAKKIDIHDPAIDVYAGIDKGTALGNTGIVDQDVDATKMRCDEINRCLTCRIPRNVTAHADGVCAAGSQLSRYGIHGGFIDIEHPEFCASSSECFADGCADSTGRSGD